MDLAIGLALVPVNNLTAESKAIALGWKALQLQYLLFPRQSERLTDSLYVACSRVPASMALALHQLQFGVPVN
jgi:hypothetical protein